MPEQPDEAAPAEAAAGGGGAAGTSDAERSAAGTEPVDPEAEAERTARVEAAKRRYRATLRNEADTGEGGFSKDYYRSQKPPHWS